MITTIKQFYREIDQKNPIFNITKNLLRSTKPLQFLNPHWRSSGNSTKLLKPEKKNPQHNSLDSVHSDTKTDQKQKKSETKFTCKRSPRFPKTHVIPQPLNSDQTVKSQIRWSKRKKFRWLITFGFDLKLMTMIKGLREIVSWWDACTEIFSCLERERRERGVFVMNVRELWGYIDRALDFLFIGWNGTNRGEVSNLFCFVACARTHALIHVLLCAKICVFGSEMWFYNEHRNWSPITWWNLMDNAMNLHRDCGEMEFLGNGN